MRSLYRPHLFLIFLALFLSSALKSALAETQTAKITNIVDGDTVTALLRGGRSIEIRLEGIDAPEHGQAFASASQGHLSKLVLGKDVNLDCNGISYNRLVCKILVSSGEDVDLDQIKAGMAWHYKQYQRLQSAIDRAEYGAAEDAARRARIGLWADANPVQPQDFRHRTTSELCLDHHDHRIACSELYDGPVRGNLRSHIYHWPGCPNYDDIAEHNRVEFASAIAAEQAGYRAAYNCP